MCFDVLSCYKNKTIARGPYKKLAAFVILETKPNAVHPILHEL